MQCAAVYTSIQKGDGNRAEGHPAANTDAGGSLLASCNGPKAKGIQGASVRTNATLALDQAYMMSPPSAFSLRNQEVNVSSSRSPASAAAKRGDGEQTEEGCMHLKGGNTMTLCGVGRRHVRGTTTGNTGAHTACAGLM